MASPLPVIRSLLRRKSVLFALWALLFLILAEIGLRWIVPAPMRVPTMFDCEASRIYGWAFPPRSHMPILNPDTGKIETIDRANSRGWKDVEHPYRKPDHTFRILIVGDSMTQGIPTTEEVFHRVLERLLQAEGYAVEVIALGVGGWSTDQEFLAYQHEGRKYRPDLVISQFTHNDLDGLMGKDGTYADSLKPFRLKLENGSLTFEKRERFIPEPTLSERLDRSLLLQSRLYFFGRNHYFRYLAPLWRKKGLGNRYLAALVPEDAGFHTAGEETKSQKEIWDLYTAILTRWKGMCKGERSPLAVFTECCEQGELEFGLRWFFERRDGKLMLKLTDGSWAEIDFDKPRRKLEEVCREVGVDLIPNQRYYERYRNDPHPNARGNRAIAEDLRDYILDHPILSNRLEAFRKKGE